jgi:hypothetical protein
MMKKINFILLMLCAMAVSFAQNGPTVTRVRYNDTIWHDKGFDAYIGAGMFIGNKYNANYYNGSNLNECNVDYVFTNNTFWEDEIIEEIQRLYPNVSLSRGALPNWYQNDPVRNSDFNWNLHYKLKTMVSLGARYKFAKGWGISLSYSFCRLTTAAMLLLTDPSTIPGNERPSPEIYFYGKEDRSMFDLSVSYVFNIRSIARPFIEFGIQGNYAKAKMLDAVVGDKNFTMLDPYMGGNYYPGAQAYDVTYGGWGFGFSGSAGLKIVVAKGVSLDPTFYFALQRLAIYQTKNGPEEYRMGNRFTPNYGVLLRVTMNDFFFSRNK